MTLGPVASYGLPILAAAMIGVVLTARWWRRSPVASVPAATADATLHEIDAILPPLALRAGALDAIAQAVLVVGADGQVLDANRAAMAMFDLSSGCDRYAGALRTLECGSVDAHRTADTDGVWNGEAWVRHPDGGVHLCLTCIVPLRGASGDAVAFAESYRDAVAEGLLADELRDRLYGLRQGSVLSSPIPESDAVREDLARLGAAFRDLELVVRQYERLLPVLSAHDPIAEAVAGLAHETLAAVKRLRVEQLLHEVPGTLARLHAATEELAHRASQGDTAEQGSEQRALPVE